MAGDWIKMRADLFTHPKVVRMASALKADTLRTVGGLMSAWCLFDAHSEDGCLDGYTPEVLDDHLRWNGFADAMISVGWLTYDQDEGLVLPRFDTHNGQSAKRRAQDADRKRDVRKTSASEADKKRTREEKRREELSTTDVVDIEANLRATSSADKAKRAAQLPDDFLPDETAIDLARSLGVNLNAELPKFCDYHKAKGKPMKDWQAALRTWIRNAAQFAKERGGGSLGRPEKFDPVAYVNRGRAPAPVSSGGVIDVTDFNLRG